MFRRVSRPTSVLPAVTALAFAVAVAVLSAASTARAQGGQMTQKPTDPAMGAMANDFKPFTKQAYGEAMAAGKTTIVFFHAPWCPVCRAQEPKVLARLNGDFKHVVAFKVDYDTNQDLRREMKVDRQSTLILSQGMKEVARLSYKSDDASIDELFSHAKMMMGGGR
jgi:thiol-disulfide isomerase/thioredoxin